MDFFTHIGVAISFLLSSIFGWFNGVQPPLTLPQQQPVVAMPTQIQPARSDSQTTATTTISSLAPVATFKQYALVIQDAVPVNPDYGVYKGKLVLINNQTGKEYTLENSYTDDAGAVILYVDNAETYAQLSEGTSVARGITVYTLSGNPVAVAAFCAQHRALFWSAHYAIYQDCEHSDAPRPWEIGAPNIVAVNLLTGATSTLVASNPLSTYGQISIDQDSLSIVVYSVSTEADWLANNGSPNFSTSTTTTNIPNLIHAAGIF